MLTTCRRLQNRNTAAHKLFSSLRMQEAIREEWRQGGCWKQAFYSWLFHALYLVVFTIMAVYSSGQDTLNGYILSNVRNVMKVNNFTVLNIFHVYFMSERKPDHFSTAFANKQSTEPLLYANAKCKWLLALVLCLLGWSYVGTSIVPLLFIFCQYELQKSITNPCVVPLCKHLFFGRRMEPPQSGTIPTALWTTKGLAYTWTTWTRKQYSFYICIIPYQVCISICITGCGQSIPRRDSLVGKVRFSQWRTATRDCKGANTVENAFGQCFPDYCSEVICPCVCKPLFVPLSCRLESMKLNKIPLSCFFPALFSQVGMGSHHMASL